MLYHNLNLMHLSPAFLENSSNNADENSDGELFNIAGKSIFYHDKIHGKWSPYY